MDEDQYFEKVCDGLGLGATPWRIAVFKFWATRESAGQLFDLAWNPLATTWESPDIPQKAQWNSVGVGIYATAEIGIAATVATLKLHYYDNIRRCLTDQCGYQEALPDFNTWIGSIAYGQQVIDYMNGLSVPKEEEMNERRLFLIQIAWGDYHRMLWAYDKCVAAGLIPNEGLGAPKEDGSLADLNAAVVKRGRIMEMAVNSNYEKGYDLLVNG